MQHFVLSGITCCCRLGLPGCCCFTQVIAMIFLSQYLVSSSRSDKPQRSFGVRRVGYAEMMWFAVCSFASHSLLQESERFHSCMDEQKRPMPVRKRLSLTQAAWAGLG